MIQLYKSKFIIFEGKVFENSSLVVKDGKFFDIIFGEEILQQAQSDGTNSEIIDYGNAVITQGFVNFHTHLQYTDLKPFFRQDVTINLGFADWITDLIRQYYFLSEEKKVKSFKHGLKEAVLSGCTTIVQLSGEDFIPEILNKLDIKSFVFMETYANSEESSLIEIKKLREKIKKIREKLSDNVVVGISPHSIYNVHKVLWQEIVKFSVEENILVHTHLAESTDEINWLAGNPSNIDKLHKLVGWDGLKPYETGLNPVDYLEKIGVLSTLKENLTAAHCIQLNEKNIEKLVNFGTKIAHCPRSNLLLHEKTLDLSCLPDFMLKNIALGTDSKFSNYDLSILNEARFLKDCTGLDFKKIMDMLTINPVRILNINKKDADFLVFKLQNNQDCQDILYKERPDDIYIKGKLTVKNGEFTAPEWKFLNEP